MTDESGGSEGSQRKIVALMYLLLMAGGICLYVIWGLMYGSWNIFRIENMTIYAFFFTMVGAGLAGVLLYGRKTEIL